MTNFYITVNEALYLVKAAGWDVLDIYKEDGEFLTSFEVESYDDVEAQAQKVIEMDLCYA